MVRKDSKHLHPKAEYLLHEMFVIRFIAKRLHQQELVVWLHWKQKGGWVRILVIRSCKTSPWYYNISHISLVYFSEYLLNIRKTSNLNFC